MVRVYLACDSVFLTSRVVSPKALADRRIKNAKKLIVLIKGSKVLAGIPAGVIMNENMGK